MTTMHTPSGGSPESKPETSGTRSGVIRMTVHIPEDWSPVGDLLTIIDLIKVNPGEAHASLALYGIRLNELLRRQEVSVGEMRSALRQLSHQQEHIRLKHARADIPLTPDHAEQVAQSMCVQLTRLYAQVNADHFPQPRHHRDEVVKAVPLPESIPLVFMSGGKVTGVHKPGD